MKNCYICGKEIKSFGYTAAHGVIGLVPKFEPSTKLSCGQDVHDACKVYVAKGVTRQVLR